MTGPLRVLHVVHSLEPGGMENGVCNIARGLESRGVETHVACLERRGAFCERLPRPDRVRVLGKGSGFSLWALWKLALAQRATRPHIVHTHNLGPLIYASMATLGGRTRAIVHGEHSQLAPWELKPRRLKQRKSLYRNCRAIHTVSQGQLAELQELGFSHPQMISIPNGVDTVRFAPGDKAAARAALGLPADAFIIALVGRFGPFKRHEALLQAFESLAPGHPSAHLVFLGSGGSEEAKVRGLAQASSVASRIHLPGFLADPAPGYRAVDLLAIPSVNEGMSNAALEAMASGVPVLGNMGCGHEQMIQHGRDGFLADLTTPEAIAAEIGKILATPERLVDMSREARMTVTHRFSMDAMLAAYEQIYRAHAR